jgi:hypothetical protein
MAASLRTSPAAAFGQNDSRLSSGERGHTPSIAAPAVTLDFCVIHNSHMANEDNAFHEWETQPYSLNCDAQTWQSDINTMTDPATAANT